MPVPTSNITMSSINSEVSSVNSTSLNTLTNNAIAYTGGNSTVVANNLSVTPNSMDEFAGYVHTQNFTNTTVRYYNGSVSSDPYAANQTTISSSSNDVTNLCSSTDTDTSSYNAYAFCEATVDLRVYRYSSLYYVDVRQDGIGTIARRLYRESNTQQTISNTNFYRIMTFQPSVSPGSIQVGITQGSTTNLLNSTTGSVASVGSQTRDGDTSAAGNFSTYGLNDFQTLSNGQSVGVQWRVYSQATNVQGSGMARGQRDSTSIFNITIKASGYNDLQLGSVMLRGNSVSTAINTGGGFAP